jgi:inorganic pyrophosphatase
MKIRIEIPRGSFVKWDQGRIEYLSPIPSPFNYGSVPSTLSADGDEEDALLLGPALPRNSVQEAPVVGQVIFLDAGVEDNKWVLGVAQKGDKRRVEGFFRLYARVRRLLNRLQGKPGITRFLEVRWRV